jgi:hypothetical protein
MYNVQDFSALYNNSVHRLSVRIGIVLGCGNHLHDGITSLRREVWVFKNSLT